MRKYLVILLLLPIFFLGCDDTDSGSGGGGLSVGKLTIKVEKFDDYDYLDEVQVFIVNLNGSERKIADCAFKESFTLNLPTEISKSGLSSIDDYVEMLADYYEMDEDDIKVSANDVKLGDLEIRGYKGNKREGKFYLYKETKDSKIYGYYIYADKAVKVTYLDKSVKINLDLKKGWNAVYTTEKDDGGEEVSTKEVSGMKWYFYEDSNEGDGGDLSDGKLTIKVEDAEDFDYLDEVQAFIVNLDGDEREIADCVFERSFTLILPTGISKSRLSGIDDYVDWLADKFYIFEGDIKVNAKDVNLGDLEIYGYESNNRAGEFYLYKETKDSEIYASYVYADKAVKVKYSDKEVKINLDIIKGWNLVYYTYNDDGSEELSSKSVSGLKWYFEEGSGGGGGDNNTVVRFRKEKDYTYITALALVNSSDQILAYHQFGTNAGTSSYFGIPSGTFMPLMYYTYPGEEGWFYFLDEPGTYNFRNGRAYTITIDDNGSSIMGYVTDEGAYSKSSVISKKYDSKRKGKFSKEVYIQKIELKNIDVKF